VNLTLDEPGTHAVEATVSDGYLTAHTLWLLTVTEVPVNSPPRILSTQPPEVGVTAFVGETIQFAADAIDPDGDDLDVFYRVNDVRTASGNTFAFTPPVGEYIVQFVASDGELSVSHSWGVTIIDPLLTLSGRIRDAVTGESIEGVLVSIGGITVVTDASGVFDFEASPPDGLTLTIRDEEDEGSFGEYFDYARVYSPSEGTYLNLFLLPNITLDTAYYSDFHQFYRAMTDERGIPASTAQRRWAPPIDLYVPPFSANGLDYREAIVSVAAEFDAIIGTPLFQVVGDMPALGVHVEYSSDIYADNYAVEEWTDDWFPVQARIRFRTSYSPGSLEPFKVVIRHELGHALGLNHSADRRHLMVGGQSPGTSWFSDDELHVIEALYRIPRGHEMLDHLRD
jgi:hypothetical protein